MSKRRSHGGHPSRAIHDHTKKVKKNHRKNPGICLDCFKYVEHLYQARGRDVFVCYPCREDI